MAASLSVSEVYEIISNTVVPSGETIELPLDQSLGHFLAEDIASPTPVPAFTNSAMDGYAFSSTVLSSASPIRLPVLGAAFAGTPSNAATPSSAAIKVTTGACVPDAYDTVIPYEKVNAFEVDGCPHIEFNAFDIKPKANVRLRGEEIKAGAVVLSAGTRLSAAEIGLAAALGRSHLKCRRIRAAVFATGDELTEPGKPLRAGAIYDVNSHLIEASLRQWGVEVRNLGILPDDPDCQRSAIHNALHDCDFLITSGGVGESEKDFTTRVLAECGDVSHYFIRMRPGKPFSFGTLKGNARTTYFFALPGNPVAAAMSAKLFLREAVHLAAGTHAPLGRLSARAATAVKGRLGRTDFVRGIIAFADGEYRFRPASSQSSAMLTSLVGMNAIAVFNEDSAGAEANEIIDVLRMPE